MIRMRLKDLLFSITLSAMPAAHSSDMINLPEPRLESDYLIEQVIHSRRSVTNPCHWQRFHNCYGLPKG